MGKLWSPYDAEELPARTNAMGEVLIGQANSGGQLLG